MIAFLHLPGAPSSVLRLCFNEVIKPIMGTALYLEYCEVCSRNKIFKKAALNETERLCLFDDFMGLCDWVSVYYLWRPNLKDEGDNHLLELAEAGGAKYIITGNVKDFHEGDLLFPEIKIVTPREFLNERRK